MQGSKARLGHCNEIDLYDYYNRLRWSTVGAPRPLHTSRRLFTEKDAKFEAAQKRVTQLKNEPDNVVKLQLYALFKQVQRLRPDALKS